MPRKRKNTTGIPDYEINSLARAILPAIQKLFEDGKVKEEFEAWKAERYKLQLNNPLQNHKSH